METTSEHPTQQATDELRDALTAVEDSEAEQDETPPIFRFSGYVDLPEEENCPAEWERRGSCKDQDHFHAWVRLTNKFQHKEIREKALASKARRQRQLRDKDSDASAVLENELDVLRFTDPEDLIEEVVARDAFKDQMEAVKDVEETEAPDQPEEEGAEPVLLYAHIDKDRERLRELEEMDDEQRPHDEYVELVKHVSAYLEAVEARVQELQAPQRSNLRDREIDDLIDIIRDDRVEQESTEEFLHTYNVYSVVFGTLTSDKSGRKFGDRGALENQAPEVVDALMLAFARIEAEAREGKG